MKFGLITKHGPIWKESEAARAKELARAERKALIEKAVSIVREHNFALSEILRIELTSWENER